MKITVLGSGSIFFTRQIVKGLIESTVLESVELALVDTNEHRCEQMGRFARQALEEAGSGITVKWTTDRNEALPGSDFVIVTFSTRNAHNRGVGVHVSQNYGIREASGDTAGPAGCVFRTLHAIPAVAAAAADIEKLCPQAWVLNYVNPTNLIGAYLDRHTSLKAYAFCDGMYIPAEGTDEQSLAGRISRYAGIDPPVDHGSIDRLEISVGGINHFVFMTGLKLDGVDIWPRFKQGLRQAAEADGIASYTAAEWHLTEMFDAYPTVVGHSMEYVRYFQGRGSHPERDFVIKPWDLNKRVRWTRKVWREIAMCNAGKLSAASLLAPLRTEMLLHVIESISGDQNRAFPVNIRNDSRIGNLPADTIVESFGTFGAGGAEVPPIGDMPRGLLGPTHQIIDYQELCLEAALSGDYTTVVRAVASDPLVMSLSDAKSIAYELMAVVDDELPDKWDSYWEVEEYSNPLYLPIT